MAEKKSPKMVEARVKFLGINWVTYETDPFDPDSNRRIGRLNRAGRGDVVKLPEREFKRLDALGAFFKDEEVAEGDATEEGQVTPLSQMSQVDLINWHRQTKPNVKDVVEAADGDPDLARRLLEAENAATDGDPRDTVVEGLGEIIARGNT